MKLEELDNYLVEHQDLSWNIDEEDNLILKLDKTDEKFKITPKAIKDLSVKELDEYLKKGRNVDHITRITGYFSKVSGWNDGKLGELKDRHRESV